MGNHLIDGNFKSDKYDWCHWGFVPLKVTDKDAQPLLWAYAQAHRSRDPGFSADLEQALKNAGFNAPATDGATHDASCCLTPSELRAEAQAACPCDDDGCGMVIRCQDHPKSGVVAKYFKNRHSIGFTCTECGADLTVIHLDERAHAQ